MVPLRRLLIVRAPTSCPTPRAPPARRCCRRPPPGAAAGAGSSWAWLIGAGVKIALGAASLHRLRTCSARCPCSPRPSWRWSWRPRCLGVGYILGYRQSAIMVAGSLISCGGADPAASRSSATGRRRRSSRRPPDDPRPAQRPQIWGALRALHRRRRAWPRPGSSPSSARCPRCTARWRRCSRAAPPGGGRRDGEACRAPIATCRGWVVLAVPAAGRDHARRRAGPARGRHGTRCPAWWRRWASAIFGVALRGGLVAHRGPHRRLARTRPRG